MNRLLLAAALVALAACKIGGSETTSAGDASCTTAGGACAANSDCCSYGCMAGVCVPNPIEGGACRTTNDCAFPRLCKSGACTSTATCRDDADVCSWRYDCCSGNCTTGACTVNNAPIADAGPNVPDAPYTQLFTLVNNSTDPDFDPLTYGWTLTVPAGSAATLSSTTAANPTFTPDVTGSYVVRLVVTDGPAGAPNRLTSQAQITIDAVNRVPVASVTAPPATWSRNVQLSLSGSVSDPDGDTLDCTWQVTAPGATAPVAIGTPSAPCGNPSAPAVQYTPTLEGAYQIDLVVHDHDRTTGAVRNTQIASATFTSVNDPPTPAVSRSPYYANLGPPAGTTPAVQLDASASTDTNGDTPLSYAWTMISASDGGALPALTNANTATPTFVPDRAVDLVARVTVTDPAQFGRTTGASSSLDVTVHVGRYVQPLGHDVIDAARATGTGIDKVVLGGHDPNNAAKGLLWVYDLATDTEGTGIPLVDPANATIVGIPALVGVTPDGTKAVVVDQVSTVGIWIVSLGATPSVSRIAAPWAIGDLVVAGNRYAYLFNQTTATTDYVRELDLTNGVLATLPWTGYGGFGAAYSVGNATWLYRVDTYWGEWFRYSVGNAGASGTAAATSYTSPQCGYTNATAVWPTLNATFASAFVISSCGDVYNASSLASMTQNVGFSPAFLDSAGDGTVVAVDSAGAALRRLNASLAPLGTDTLPAWAENGYGRTLRALRAFLNDAATKRVAVVSDNAAPVRYGVVTFP